MKRITVLSALLACGLTATTALAQSPSEATQTQTPPAGDMPKPAPIPNWFSGNTDMVLLGRDNVASSKFEEYRVVPKGVSLPVFQFQGTHNGMDFAVLGRNVSLDDQRYMGWGNTSWLGVRFDYNQIPHNMGNDGRTIENLVAPGDWSMSATLRKTLGDAVDATTSRTYPFYTALLQPTFDAANHFDVSSLRKRGEITFDVSRKLPFNLDFTYNRDVKTGFRGALSGDILGVVTLTADTLEPVDEVTQDFGVRWAWNVPKKGNVHASFNRNVYNDRLNSIVVDNPFRATDLAYVSTSVPGGPASVRFGTPPDNEANRGAFGAMYKFGRQSQVTADLAFGQWTQNAPFLPYTINSVILTGSGQPANSTASLQQQSLDGKIDTASYNFTFASRPTDPLAIRLRYRNYSYKDKSARYLITGDTSSSPDRSWSPVTTTPEELQETPYGQATANRTDSSIGHFEAQAAYDINRLTLEGVYRNIQTSWVGRAASSGTDGKENGYTLAAILHSREWLSFRAHFDQNKRKVSGIDPDDVAALQGVMADHAERNQTLVGFNVDLMPSDKYGATFAYSRRNDDYPNRPFKVANDPRTESGLLKASYDMFSVDFNYNPNARAELSAFYTYEKAIQTNQWVTLTSGAVNNILTYVPSDKGNTFGVNGVFHLVPDKWTLTAVVQQQNLNGFWDITALESGSFYTPGRTTLIPRGQGGAADVNDYDDFKQTTAVLDLGYTFAKSWTLSGGYALDKYTQADAFSEGTSLMPQAVLIFLKANNGNYTANIGYTRLTYRF